MFSGCFRLDPDDVNVHDLSTRAVAGSSMIVGADESVWAGDGGVSCIVLANGVHPPVYLRSKKRVGGRFVLRRSG